MKKIFIFFIFALMFSFPVQLFAQTAKIIDLNGEVSIKRDASSPWQKAALNLDLEKQTEIKTGKNSNCTLAFDADKKNIATIAENTQARINSVKPGEIFLPEGRVFALIKNLAKSEKFQVRTPTAVSGARGTGWLSDFHNNINNISCFDDQAFVEGLDGSGNPTEETGLDSGSGINVGEGGALGDRFQLGDSDYEQWNGFLGGLNDPSADNEDEDNSGEMGALEELREEQQQDFSQESSEERREETESADSSSSSRQGGGGGGNNYIGGGD